MPLTHEFLSVMLGVRRPSISVAAAELQREGIISYRRRVITITDMERLRAAACECAIPVEARLEAFRDSVDRPGKAA